MKIQYLAINEKTSALQEIRRAEYRTIMAANSDLPNNERRFFIKDDICDGGELDRIYIEVPKEEYDEWHKKAEAARRKRAPKKEYQFLSGDVVVGANSMTLFDTIPDPVDIEKNTIDKLLQEALRTELASWHLWALDFLDLYLSCSGKISVEIICKKQGIAERTARDRKQKFETFVLDFYQRNE